MRAGTRRVLEALDACARAKTAKEVWAFHVPDICEEWLYDPRRVQWLQEGLGQSGLVVTASPHDQQIGQIFCNVVERWGEYLVEQKAPEPQAIMTHPDLPSWQAAMLRYPWDLHP